MPNLEDYIGKGAQMLADEEENGERPFPSGSLVIVTHICDWNEPIYPQVVRLETNESYGGRVRGCNDEHRYLATFADGTSLNFSDSECKPYNGDRTDAPFRLDEDDDDEPRSSDRPTVGDLIVLHDREEDWSRSQNPSDNFPQVVRIDRDDEDSCPWRVTLLSGEAVYVTEEGDEDEDDGLPVWERYTGSRDPSEAPFLLDDTGLLWALRTEPPQDNAEGADETLVGPFKNQAALLRWAENNVHGVMVRLRKP